MLINISPDSKRFATAAARVVMVAELTRMDRGMKKRTLTLDAGELTYLHGGEGPLVVLTHALGPVAWGSLESLQTSCRVAMPVWAGSSVDASSRLTLRWFVPLVRDMGCERATLCAWSMSGPMAIEFAAEGPAQLARLILVDVAGLGGDWSPLRLRDLPHLLLTKLTGRPTRGFLRIMWRNWIHRRDLDPGPLIEASYQFFRNDPNARAGPPDGDDIESPGEFLSSIDVPTLVLTGRHSTVLGPEDAQHAVSMLPHGRLIVFEHSSHAPQLEEPARFQEEVAVFVNETDV